jgi:molybdopterin/thiamine biosynthesis adenylyltransferase
MSEREAAGESLLRGLAGLDLKRLRKAAVVIAGAGNIGSHLAPLLARAGVRLLRIVDRDRVEAKNLANQDFRREHVGGWKAEMLADRIRGQFLGLTVEARPLDLEDLPLGQFDVDVIFGALDSRRARQALLSEIAWPLGVPAVDGGVGEGLVGRVQVFVPGVTTACLECGWGNADYARLAEEYPCERDAVYNAPSTLSPAFGGSVVAGLMAAEGVRLLAGETGAESREISFDLCHRRFLVSRLRRAPRCRFDHAVVRDVIRVPGRTVGDLLDAAGRRFRATPVHLESRRGLLGGRFTTPDSLRPRASETLAALGVLAGDRLRVRSATESVWLVVEG